MQYTQTKHAQKPPGTEPLRTGTGWNGLGIGCIATGLPNGTAATTGAPLSPAGTVKTGCTGIVLDVPRRQLGAASVACFLAFFSSFSS
jgi:hypothetical protein